MPARWPTATVAIGVMMLGLLGFPPSPASAAESECVLAVRLEPGDRDRAVRCLERRLRALGFRVGDPDAEYDAASVSAVRAFQRQRGLYPDGIVTSITSRQLGLRGGLPPAGAPRITVLGDSTAAAMRWYDEARNQTTIYDVMGRRYDLVWSVESCRRLVKASCVGRIDPGTGHRWQPVSVLPLMRGSLRGRLGDAVVVMAGYDDYPSIRPAIDAIVREAKSQGVARVFWLTYRTTHSYGYGRYYRKHNTALQAARKRHPGLVVLDWNAYTRRQSRATQSAWFESDGVHLTRRGGVALARYLRERVSAAVPPGGASGAVDVDPGGPQTRP